MLSPAAGGTACFEPRSADPLLCLLRPRPPCTPDVIRRHLPPVGARAGTSDAAGGGDVLQGCARAWASSRRAWCVCCSQTHPRPATAVRCWHRRPSSGTCAAQPLCPGARQAVARTRTGAACLASALAQVPGLHPRTPACRQATWLAPSGTHQCLCACTAMGPAWTRRPPARSPVPDARSLVGQEEPLPHPPHMYGLHSASSRSSPSSSTHTSPRVAFSQQAPAAASLVSGGATGDDGAGSAPPASAPSTARPHRAGLVARIPEEGPAYGRYARRNTGAPDSSSASSVSEAVGRLGQDQSLGELLQDEFQQPPCARPVPLHGNLPDWGVVWTAVQAGEEGPS